MVGRIQEGNAGKAVRWQCLMAHSLFEPGPASCIHTHQLRLDSRRLLYALSTTGRPEALQVAWKSVEALPRSVGIQGAQNSKHIQRAHRHAASRAGAREAALMHWPAVLVRCFECSSSAYSTQLPSPADLHSCLLSV